MIQILDIESVNRCMATLLVLVFMQTTLVLLVLHNAASDLMMSLISVDKRCTHYILFSKPLFL